MDRAFSDYSPESSQNRSDYQDPMVKSVRFGTAAETFSVITLFNNHFSSDGSHPHEDIHIPATTLRALAAVFLLVVRQHPLSRMIAWVAHYYRYSNGMHGSGFDG